MLTTAGLNRLQSSLFFLMLIILNIKGEQNKQKISEIKDHIDFFNQKINLNPELLHFFLDETPRKVPDWHELDAQFIHSRFTTESRYNPKINKLILKLHSKYPAYKDLIELAFNYNPDFKISVSDTNFPEIAPSSFIAAYSGTTKILYIKEKTANSFFLENSLVHELLHAANDAAQRAIHQVQQFHSAPYYPNDMEKYLSFFEIGDARIGSFIRETESLTMKKSKGTLLKSEKTIYDRNQQVLKYLDTPPYCMDRLNSVKQGLKLTFSQLNKLKQYNFEEGKGKIFNMDGLLNGVWRNYNGPFLIEEVRQTDTGLTLVVSFFAKPIEILKSILNNLDNHILKSYKLTSKNTEDFISEKQAYLYEYLPLPLLKELYPELLAYDETFRKDALSKAIPNGYDDNPFNALIAETALRDQTAVGHHYNYEMRAGTLNAVTVENSHEYFGAAQLLYIFNKDAKNAESICNGLSNKGFFKVECYEGLADIAYRRKNYNMAYTYYHRASKSNQLKNSKSLYQYAESAFESGHIAEAKKIVTKHHESKSKLYEAEMNQLFTKIKANEHKYKRKEL